MSVEEARRATVVGQPGGQLVSTEMTYPTLAPLLPTVGARRQPSRLLSARVGPLLRLADVLGVLAAGALVGLGVEPTLLLVLGVLAVLGWFELYRSRLTLSVLNQAPVLVLGPILAGGLVGAAIGLRSGDIDSVKALLRTAAVASLVIVVGRLLLFSALRSMRRAGVSEHRVLVLGAGQVAARLVKVLQERREFGLRPVAVWDREPMLAESDLGVTVVGAGQDLATAIRAYDATVVIIAFAKHPESGLVDVVRTCDRMQCEIFVVPRLYELHHRSAMTDEVRGLPLMRLRRAAFRTWRWHVKRMFDVFVAGVLISLLAPLLAVLALAVRWEGRGRRAGVLFRQLRIGLDGRPFQLLKFRSLLPADDSESATLWSIAKDHRVGPVGKFIRRLSLDELPQLWNVLRGDMTLVGPRPERPHFVEQFTAEFPRYVARHRVPAGVTGWAQVHGLRGDTSIEERAAFDNYYIENWSLWLDVTILLRTVRAVLSREGS